VYLKDRDIILEDYHTLSFGPKEKTTKLGSHRSCAPLRNQIEKSGANFH